MFNVIFIVALGGAANVIPVLFGKLHFTKPSMIKMMCAVAAGLTTVYALNIAWCYYLLRIIPQLGDEPSLQYAEQKGTCYGTYIYKNHQIQAIFILQQFH